VKLETPVDFPVDALDMPKLFNCDGNIFDLSGVIEHIGSSLESGHYVAFARGLLGWNKFNDEFFK
jgi:uncharacterized UBP type Zn finger protein